MPTSGSHLELEFLSSLNQIDRAEWNRLAGPDPSPFLEWEWLAALERSGSISPEHGWQPYHAVFRRGGRTLAVAPLYLKSHSMGEFVFDFAWADVAEQLGIQYYPKLVGMSPATPSVCFHPLVDPQEDREQLYTAFVDCLETLVEQLELGSAALNYVEPSFADYLERHGFHRWKHQHFLWINAGFHEFADYLAAFTKNQRRNIRRERKSIADQGLRIELHQGDHISSQLLELMYRYYRNTNDQFGPWAARFLTREFFPLAAREPYIEFCRQRILIFAAYDDKRSSDPVALSFLVRKGTRLFGRYWGAAEFYENLHFELCYYAPIEYAIREGITSFDPGIGSAHKVRRGFRAVPNYSLHRFRDERMNALMKLHIDRINEMEQHQIDALNASLPFA